MRIRFKAVITFSSHLLTSARGNIYYAPLYEEWSTPNPKENMLREMKYSNNQYKSDCWEVYGLILII